MQGLRCVILKLAFKTNFCSHFIARLHELLWQELNQLPDFGATYLCPVKTPNKMKTLIIILVGCILTSCGMQVHCPTYLGSKGSAKHKKSHAYFAKHSKTLGSVNH